MSNPVKVFYLKAFDQNGQIIATSVQVIVPQGLTWIQTRDYVVGRIAEEVASYMAAECLTAVGMPNPSLSR